MSWIGTMLGWLSELLDRVAALAGGAREEGAPLLLERPEEVFRGDEAPAQEDLADLERLAPVRGLGLLAQRLLELLLGDPPSVDQDPADLFTRCAAHPPL